MGMFDGFPLRFLVIGRRASDAAPVRASGSGAGSLGGGRSGLAGRSETVRIVGEASLVFDEFSAPEGGFGRLDALLGEMRGRLADSTLALGDVLGRPDGPGASADPGHDGSVRPSFEGRSATAFGSAIDRSVDRPVDAPAAPNRAR